MKIIHFVIFSFFLTACNTQELKKPDLTGKWQLENSPNIFFEFTEGGMFHHYVNGEKQNSNTFEQNEDGTLVEIDYGQLMYNEQIREDSIYVELIGDKNGKVNTRYLCFVDKDYLTLVNYKNGPNIDHHVQMVNTFIRAESEEKPIDYKNLSLNIPVDFNKNEIYIAFEQEDGVLPRIDIHGNINLDIPISGILSTSVKEDYRIISFGKVQAFIQEKEGHQREIEVAQFSQTPASKLKDGPFLIVERFNPSRDLVNSIYGSKIKGNVLTFEYKN